MNSESVVECILEAIGEANSRYEKWSGGDWLVDAAAEGLMQVLTAEALFTALGDCKIVLEANPFALLKSSSGTATYKKTDDYSRFDIVVCDAIKNPIYIVELKRVWQKKQASKDLQRIADFRENWNEKKGGHLKGGVFAFMVGTSLLPGARSLNRRKTNVLKSAKPVLDQLGHDAVLKFGQPWYAPLDGYVEADRRREGCAACIQIT